MFGITTQATISRWLLSGTSLYNAFIYVALYSIAKGKEQSGGGLHLLDGVILVTSVLIK